MTPKKTILIFCLIPVVLLSYEWSSVGPDTVQVNDYLSSAFGDVLCISDGILIYDWKKNDWVKYTNAAMPALQAVDFDTSGIMVILSDSSWSDGIYKFDMKKKEFGVLKYAAFPRFLQHYSQDAYYCGYGYGLLKSNDGIEWEEVAYFKGKNCLAMARFGDVLLVSEHDKIHYSHDQGKSWTPCAQSPATVSAIAWDQNGIAFAIFPGDSRSSGLWSSADSGQTWQVEFWSTNMSTARFTYGELFVSWEKPDEDNWGTAIWNKPTAQLIFMNDGLPETPVNRFSENTLIDCYNVVVCTDSGAFMTCDFPIGLEKPEQTPGQFSLRQNYPNPFNPKTIISYSVWANNHSPRPVDLSIYNNLGQKVVTLVSKKKPAGSYQVEWNAGQCASGIYYYRLSTDQGFSETKKMILLR